MSYCLDANVFITAWHESHPPEIFPTLYKKMEDILPEKIILIKPIFDEIEPLPSGKPSRRKMKINCPVRLWLQEAMHIKATPINADVKKKALKLKDKYETDDNSQGAGETDIDLIAFASLNNHTVVTLEAEQKQIPGKKRNYRIPLICKKENVRYINFVEMLRQCDIRV